MVNVKLYGVLRLRSGIKECDLEAAKVKEIFAQLESLCQSKVSAKEFKTCITMVNGKQCGAGTKLNDGDKIALLTPASGG